MASSRYTDQQIKDTLTGWASFKNDGWVRDQCIAFWSIPEHLQLAKSVMDTMGIDLPSPTDYTARHRFLWLGKYFKQFSLPYPETANVCPNIKALKTAFTAERTNLANQRLTQYAVVRWTDIQGGALTEIEGMISGMYARLNCDQVITTQEQATQIGFLNDATNSAITNADGSGINYTMWAVIAIVIIVVIVVIKKLSNG